MGLEVKGLSSPFSPSPPAEGEMTFGVRGKFFIRPGMEAGENPAGIPNPLVGGKFMGSEDFVQEAFVGYKYGSLMKLGVVCERTPRS